jgi:hypothetical protein
VALICDMGRRQTAPGGFIRGKTSSGISGHPDIPCILLLDDPANKLLLPVGLGAHRILTPVFFQPRTICKKLLRTSLFIFSQPDKLGMPQVSVRHPFGNSICKTSSSLNTHAVFH